MNQRRVAVIIPFYNGQEYIAKCLESISCDPSDVWIIDNSESPFTFENPINQIITEHKKLGFAKTVNIGMKAVKEADYQFAVVMNQDAYFEAGHYAAFEKELLENKDFFIVPQLFTENFQQNIEFVIERYFPSGIPTEKTELKDYVGVTIGGAIDLFLKDGGFDESFFMYFEENDLFRRAEKARPVLFIPSVHVAHKNKPSRMSAESLKWFFRSELLYAKKHESRFRYLFLLLKYYVRKLVGRG